MAISKNSRVAKQAAVTKGVEIFYGTKPEWVVQEVTGITLDKLFPNASAEPVLLCKDDQGEYLTGKSYVGTHLLDPYRMYHRKGLEAVNA